MGEDVPQSRGGGSDYINIKKKKFRIKNMTGHTEGYSVIR